MRYSKHYCLPLIALISLENSNAYFIVILDYVFLVEYIGYEKNDENSEEEGYTC